MSDNEDTLALLGHAEILSVENSVGPPIPDVPQPGKEAPEGAPAVGREDAGYILPDDPSRAKKANQCDEGHCKTSSGVGKSATKPGNGEGLARCSTDKNIGSCRVVSEERREVAIVRHLWKAVRQHRRWKVRTAPVVVLGYVLRAPDRGVPDPAQRHFGRPNPRAYRSERHSPRSSAARFARRLLSAPVVPERPEARGGSPASNRRALHPPGDGHGPSPCLGQGTAKRIF